MIGMLISQYVWKALAAAVLALAALAGGWHLGATNERAGWLQKQAEQVIQAQAEFDAALRAGNAAAVKAQAASRRASTFAATNKTELANVRIPLTNFATGASPGSACVSALGGGAFGVVGAVAHAAPGAADAGVSVGAAASGASPPGTTAEFAKSVADDGPGNGGDLALTQHAVRLWNSALAGQQTAAGACDAADPTNRACAADARVTLTDAWANHADNAASCRADRAQLSELIALIKQHNEEAR